MLLYYINTLAGVGAPATTAAGMLSRAASFLRNPSFRLLPSAPISSTPPALRRRRSGEDEATGVADGGNFIVNPDPKKSPRLFVVQPRYRSDSLLKAKLAEALNLATSLEEQRDELFDGVAEGKRELPHYVVVQNPAERTLRGRADAYFGPGTIESVKCHMNAIESEGEVDAIFVNCILSGIQQRTLETAWGRPVLDRVGLIIEIFNAHAQTKEAKLQAELAALMYKRARLVRVQGPDGRLTFGRHGEAQVVSARGRGSGGQGFMSGAGETELQLQKRRILERRMHLMSQIEEVRRTRALQRANRKRRGGTRGQGLPTVAIVGYTNAGKSTLVSALSDCELYSDDRLFATVDTRLRSVVLPSGRKVILSDTVGFISDLPVQLVEAFHATLEEVVEADLLVHVLDSTASNVEEQKTSVLQVLQQIGVPEDKITDMIEVWNKIDLLKENQPDQPVDDLFEIAEKSEDDELSLIDSLQEEEVDEDVNSDHEQGEIDCEESISNQEQQVVDANVKSEREPKEVEHELEEVDCEESISDNEQARAIDENVNSKDDPEDLDYDESDSDHDQPSHETLPYLKDTCKDINNHIVGVNRLETSAITGVGLQELLHLIDEKLKPRNTSGKPFYDQKWRPCRSEVEAAS